MSHRKDTYRARRRFPVAATHMTVKVQQELEALCRDVVREYQGRAGYGALTEEEWAAAVYARIRQGSDTESLSAGSELHVRIARTALNVYAEALYYQCRSSRASEQRRAYQELVAYLYRIAFNLTKTWGAPAGLAEDCTQDALARIWRHIDRCRQPGAFLKWAAVILTRTTQRTLAREPDDLPEPSPEDAAAPLTETAAGPPEGPQGLAERQDMVDILLAAIKGLPDTRQHAILLWGFLGGLSDAEIARRLGINRNHVHQLRFRALTALRRDQALLQRLRTYLPDGL